MSLTDRELNKLKNIASIANELIGKAEANIITAGLKAAKAEEKKAKKASGKVEKKEAKKSLPKDPEKAVSKLAKKAARKAAKKVDPKVLAFPL